MATGTNPFTGDSLNSFQQWIAPPISIILGTENFPFGTGLIWDIGAELNSSKINEK
jgi:hypothetical protein